MTFARFVTTLVVLVALWAILPRDFVAEAQTTIRNITVSSMPADATELPAAASLGDNTANPTVPGVAAFLMCFDSATWDRCLVNVDMTIGTAFGTAGPGVVGSYKEFDGSALPTTANVGTEEEANPFATTLVGIAYGFLTNEDGSKELGKLEDDAHASADYGMPVWTRRIDAAATSGGASADYATLNTDALGLAWTRQLDPCSGVAKLYYVVNISSATTVEIANAVASEFWHICSVNLVAAAAQTIAIGHDDTDGCGSITAGMHGGATAATGWSFAANGGIALGNGSSTVMKSATANHYLCVITGQAAQISGTISYVSAP